MLRQPNMQIVCLIVCYVVIFCLFCVCLFHFLLCRVFSVRALFCFPFCCFGCIHRPRVASLGVKRAWKRKRTCVLKASCDTHVVLEFGLLSDLVFSSKACSLLDPRNRAIALNVVAERGSQLTLTSNCGELLGIEKNEHRRKGSCCHDSCSSSSCCPSRGRQRRELASTPR